jgi:hypothetical protein
MTNERYLSRFCSVPLEPLLASPFGLEQSPGDEFAGQTSSLHEQTKKKLRVSAEPEAPSEVLAEIEDQDSEEFFDTLSDFGEESPDAIDWENDPLESSREASGASLKWTHSFFSQFEPRKPSLPDDDSLRQNLSEILAEIEAGPPVSNQEEVTERLTEWLRSVKEKIHHVDDFVAGSFSRHVAAWEELLSKSSWPASRKVLSWLRSGIKPSFVGTAECDPKKLERVRRMLRRVIGESRVDEWLSGQVSHPVELPNHRSFYDNSEFGVQAVGEMLINSTSSCTKIGRRSPK